MYKVGNIYLCWGSFSRVLIGCTFFRDGKAFKSIIDKSAVKNIEKTFLKGIDLDWTLRFFGKNMDDANMDEDRWTGLVKYQNNMTRFDELKPIAIVDNDSFDYEKFVKKLTGTK